MLWLDILYTKVGEISGILYVAIGNIGTEIVNTIEALRNLV